MRLTVPRASKHSGRVLSLTWSLVSTITSCQLLYFTISCRSLARFCLSTAIITLCCCWDRLGWHGDQHATRVSSRSYAVVEHVPWCYVISTTRATDEWQYSPLHCATVFSAISPSARAKTSSDRPSKSLYRSRYSGICPSICLSLRARPWQPTGAVIFESNR